MQNFLFEKVTTRSLFKVQSTNPIKCEKAQKLYGVRDYCRAGTNHPRPATVTLISEKGSIVSQKPDFEHALICISGKFVEYITCALTQM
jgi:hypothetical protein